ncbi:hypothetical protein IFM46972_02806 [Aspergillus udagawae]|uniref:Uncharacterized protein n=1 Tax=Aspergillus udagawae TaxID=91492 RepID=A0A8H3NAA4_9EURO|nr:hypothetical protein IFM46972_02806 [Aspergillus udagawae]
MLPIRPLNLLLDLRRQIPKIPIMLAEHTVRQLMTQRFANRPIIAVAVVRIRAQPQLDHLAFIPVQAERPGLARAVLCHGRADARVVAQAGQELQRPRRVGQVREREEPVEGSMDAACCAGGGAPGAVLCCGGGAGFEALAGFGCLGVQGLDFLGWGAEEGEFEFGGGEREEG